MFGGSSSSITIYPSIRFIEAKMYISANVCARFAHLIMHSTTKYASLGLFHTSPFVPMTTVLYDLHVCISTMTPGFLHLVFVFKLLDLLQFLNAFRQFFQFSLRIEYKFMLKRKFQIICRSLLHIIDSRKYVKHSAPTVGRY